MYHLLPIKYGESVIIEIADRKKHGESIEQLVNNDFLPNLPFVKALPRQISQFANQHTVEIALQSIEQGCSLVAVDAISGHVIGMRISIVDEFKANKSSRYDEISESVREVDSDLFKLYNFNAKIENAACTETFDLNDGDLIYSNIMLGVDSRFANRGIASKLVEISISVARDRRCKLIKVISFGVKSQKVFEKNGFQTILEANVEDHVIDDVNVFEELTENVVAKYMVLRL